MLIGVNGNVYYQFSNPQGAFRGFQNSGDPARFRGNPFIINDPISLNCGFSDCSVYFGGAIQTAYIRFTAYDGDTQVGGFDQNDISLRLNGFDVGNWSAITTEITDESGLNGFGQVQGFGNQTLNTGWFTSTNPALLANILSTGQTTTQVFDRDPNDNYWDFRIGNNLSNQDIVTVAPGYTIEKSADRPAFAAVGETVTYSYIVTNIGSVPIRQLSVGDDKIGSVSCDKSVILDTDPGGTADFATCQAPYLITQEDIDAGEVTNVANAIGVPDYGTLGELTDTLSLRGPDASPELFIEKTSTLSNFGNAGTSVPYSFLIRNDGNVTLSNFTVSDSLIPTLVCNVPDLAPGDDFQCSGSYTVLQSDVDDYIDDNADQLSNTVVVSADTPRDGRISETDTLDLPGPAPVVDLELTKTAIETSYAAEGDTLNYQITLRNAGNVTFPAPPTVTDPEAGTVSCPAGAIRPGNSTTCTASYSVTQNDIDNGSFTNTASGTITVAGQTDTENDSATVTATRTPGLSLDKSLDPASPSQFDAAGIGLEYDYLLTNTGNVTLENISVIDNRVAVNCPVSTLAPGNTTTCSSAIYSTRQGNVNNGGITNTATANATEAVTGSPVVSNSDSVTVPALQRPEIELNKTAPNVPAEDYTAGRVVSYTFEVRNIGNVRIGANIGVAEIIIDDDKIGQFTCFTGDLTRGQTRSCNRDYTLTADDVTAGVVVNTATAEGTGTSDIGTFTSEQVSAIIAPTFDPSISLTKTATTASISSINDPISYSFEVRNTGNTNIFSPITIDDPLLSAPAVCNQPSPVAPNQTFTCTGSRNGVTQTEFDSGSIDNEATARFDFLNGGVTTRVTSNASTASVPVVGNPAVTLTKVGPSSYAPGETLAYTFRVTNTGNVTLRSATVRDPLIPALNCTLSDIAPGAFQECTGQYTVTQQNVDDEAFTNTAQVNAQPALGAQQSDTGQSSATLASGTGTKIASLDKTADRAAFSIVGEEITFTLAVENAGTQTLTNLAVSDTLDSSFNCTIPRLAPGVIDRSCTFQVRVTQEDIDRGSISNSATVDSSEITAQTDSETVNGPARNAAFIFEKSAPAAFAAAGQDVTFDFLVRNTGNVTLSNVVITDTFFDPTFTCTIATLAPSAADRSCSATYRTDQADVDRGGIINSASADVGAPEGVTPPATQTASVTVDGPDAAPAVTITKDSTDGAFTSVDDSEVYSFIVRNTGNVSLTNLTVTDTDLGFTCTLSDLAPGAQTTQCDDGSALSATRVFDQGDVDRGGYTNVATVSGESLVGGTPVSNSDSATVNGPTQTVALQIDKTSNFGGLISAVGESVSYGYRVFNRANITLTNPITVNDNRIQNVFCPTIPTAGIAPGGFIDCTASTMVTQQNLDDGFVENTATASVTQSVIPQTVGGPTSITATSPADTLRIDADQEPELSILKRIKTGSATSIAAVDDLVTFEYVVTNTGNVTTTAPITVSDDKIPGILTCTAAPLVPGGSVTCEQDYEADQIALNNGEVTNIATASTVFDGSEETSDPDSVTINAVQNPKLMIEKTFTGTSRPGFFDVGDVLSYSYVVTNPGNVSIDGPISLDDTLISFPSAFTCDTLAGGVLDPGGSYTCIASYTVTQNDLDLGAATNVVTARGSFGGQPVVSPADDAIYPVDALPAITLTKEALSDPAMLSEVNDVITYRFTVTNTGNVGLVDPITIEDDRMGTLACKPAAGAGVPPLSTSVPNNVFVCEFPYEITQADLDRGFVTNNATARTTYASGGSMPTTVSSRNADATVSLDEVPALNVLKELTTAVPSGAVAGQTLDYRITASNDGNQTLRGVGIADPLIPDLSCTVTPGGAAAPANVTLAPGAALMCTGSYEVTQADFDSQTLTNTATATGTDPQGDTLRGTDDVAAPLATPAPAMTVAKRVLREVGPTDDFVVAGQEIIFAVSIENTGNITLAEAKITDARDVRPATCTVGPIAPGATDDSCRFTYVTTQADVDTVNIVGSDTFGGFTNVATAIATPANPDVGTITESGDVFVRGPLREPDFLLSKSADSSQISIDGQTITYSFRIVNAGNVSLTEAPQIDDDRIGIFSCGPLPAGGLAPQASFTCRATDTVTQADIDSGGVTNVATATSSEVPPKPAHTATLTIPSGGDPALSLVKTPSATSGLAAGQDVTYTYVVRNIGNFTLTDVTLVDRHQSASGLINLPIDDDTLTDDVNTAGDSTDTAGPGVWSTLAPGDQITFTATYTVNADDIDQQVTLSNLATVTATPPAGQTAPVAQDNAAVAVAKKMPGLAVTKTADTSAITAPAVIGQGVSFTIVVTNTGNQSLSAPSIDDSFTDAEGATLTLLAGPDLDSGDANSNSRIDVGEVWTYVASYDLTQQAIDAGGFNNSVTVEAFDPQGQTLTDSDVIAPVTIDNTPTIAVVKTAVTDDGGDGTLDAGDTIGYTYTVSNTGNVTVWDVTLSETAFGGSGSTPVPTLTGGGVEIGGASSLPDLPVGAGALIYSATYTLTQADIDAGAISNQATATGASPAGISAEDVSDDESIAPGADDPTVTPLGAAPGLVVEKRADVSGLSALPQVGETIAYTITVANTGNVTLSAPVITDTLLDGDGAALVLSSGPSFSGGDANGDGALDVGEAFTYLAQFTLDQQAIDSEAVSNSVLAQTTTPDNTPLSDTSDDDAGGSDGNADGDLANDPTVVPLAVNPGVAILKSVTLDDGGDGRADAGDTLTYVFTVSNTGSQTLYDVTLAETSFTGTGSAPVPAYQGGGAFLGGDAGTIDLPAGSGTVVFTATYQLTQADIDSGGVSNQAQASVTDPDVATLSDLSDPVNTGADNPTPILLNRTPVLQTVKRATPSLSSPVAVGDRINYTIELRNIGNVTMRNPRVADTLTDADGGALTLTDAPVFSGGDLNGDSQLDIGEVWTYAAGFNLTQQAIDAGGVSNTATGTANDPLGTPISDVSDDSADAAGDSDPSTTTLPRAPAIGLVKTAALDAGVDGIASVGDTVRYTYIVTNLGNVSLYDIAIVETDFTGNGPAPTPALQSGGADLGGGPTADLPVGSVPMIFAADYTLTQADVDAGTLDNAARVDSVAPDGASVSDLSDEATAGDEADDPTTLRLPESPGLDVTKTADTSGLSTPARAGDTINFTIAARNTGNVSLASVLPEDEFTRRDGTPLVLAPTLASGDGGVAGTLDVGETWTYTASYTLVQADVDAGGVRNQATVRAQTPAGTPVEDASDNGDDTDGNDRDDPTAVNVAGAPAFTLAKQLSADAPMVIDTPDQLVPFDFVVTNTGNLTLTETISVRDPIIDAQGRGSVSCPAPPLAPGAQIVCTGSYAVTQDDIDNGSFDNIATAQIVQPVAPLNPGDPESVTLVSDPSVVSVPVTRAPAVQVTKDFAPGSKENFNAAGDTISYRFAVTNIGNVTLPGPITIDDDRIGTGLACVTGPLSVGAEATCDYPWVAEQADIDAGGVTNTATAVTGFDGNEVRSDPASLTAPALQTVSLGFTKELVSATPDAFDVGSVLEYRFTVRNTGNVTVDGPLLIDDTLATNASCSGLSDGVLLPGSEHVCSGSYTLRAGDIALGSTTNVASASGTFDDAAVISGSDEAVYPVGATPALSLTKVATPDDVTFAQVDDVITYRFTVENAANVGLTEDIVVNDNRIGAPIICFDASEEGVFGTGQTAICEATYKVTQNDLDAGSVTNEAVASTTFAPGTLNEVAVLSPPVTETVDATLTPAVSLSKELVDAPATVGLDDVLTYRITARNDGNQTLSAVAVRDPLIAGLSCFDDGTAVVGSVVLDPGAALVCEGSYKVQQSDVDAGVFFNTAEVAAQTPQGDAVEATAQVAAPIEQAAPALEIVKTLEPVPADGTAAYTQPGEVLKFRLTARNAGNVTLRDIALSDTLATVPATCAVETLKPGQVDGSCLVAYTVTQADVDAVAAGDAFAGFVNVATGTATAATPGAEPVDGRGDLFVRGPAPAPAFSLVKSADVPEITAAGDEVIYTYLVTNTGNITLTSQPIVTDDRIANVNCAPIPGTGLAPGDELSCSAPYVVTQADIDGGGVTNIASVASEEVPLPAMPGAETAQLTIPSNAAPALVVEKTADAVQDVVAGQIVTYRYRVTNAGNVTLSNVAVSDQHSSSSGTVALDVAGDTLATDAAPVGDSIDTTQNDAVWSRLAPDDSAGFTATYEITQADVDAQGAITNRATANAQLPDGTSLSGEDTLEVTPASPTAELTVIKTVDLADVSDPPVVGETLPYTIVVANTGNQSLRDVALTDSLRRLDNTPVALTQRPRRTGGDGGQPDVLEVGETWTYRLDVVITQADVDAGGLANTAQARATTPQSALVIDQSDDGVASNGEDNPTVTPIAQTFALDVMKTVVEPAALPGETAIFEITVENAGNVTLSDVSILEENLERADGTTLGLDAAPIFQGSSLRSSEGTLLPGEISRYRVAYTLTQDDLDAGGIRNSVRVSGGPPQGAPFTDVSDDGDDGDGNVLNDPTELIIEAAPALALVKSLAKGTVDTFDAVGQTIGYTFEVTNTGNVSITEPIEIVDARLTDAGGTLTCPPLPEGGLSPGAALLCSGTLSTSQADVDAGRIENIATATSQGVTSAPSAITILAQQEPSLSLVKTADTVAPEDFVTGLIVQYSYVTTNTGNTTISAPITVSDSLIAPEAISCDVFPDEGLLPGESTTCRAPYTVTATDVDLGSVVNLASATDGETTSALTSATVPQTGVPALSLVKGVQDGATFAAAGDIVPFFFTVTNTGTRAFAAPVTVSDALIGEVTCFTPTATDPDLRAGETVSCQGDYTVTQADVDRGRVVNEAFAQTIFGRDRAQITSEPSVATVAADTSPALTLEKTAATLPVREVGQVLTYTLTATNVGNQTLRGIRVSDPMLNGFDCTQETLRVGAALTCEGTYTVTQEDFDTGGIDNAADVVGISPQGDEIVGAASLRVATPTAAPALELVKAPTASPFGAAGNTLGFLFEVRNTGNVTLSDLMVTDAMVDGFTCEIASLAPGDADRSCALTVEVRQDDVDAGEIVNTARVAGKGPDGTQAEASGSVTVPGPERRGAIAATKTVGAAPSIEGAAVPFTLQVANVGNVRLTDVRVADVMTDNNGGPIALDAPFALQSGSDTNADGVLDLDEVWLYTATHTLTQTDLNSGRVLNQVTVAARDPQDRPVTDLSDNGNDSDGNTIDDVTAFVVVAAPALDVTKVVSSAASRVGETVLFEITALNIGNQALNGLDVVDRLTRADGTQLPVEPQPVSVPETLQPGESAVWQVPYMLLQDDIDAGGLSNTAAVSAISLDGARISDVSDNKIDNDGNVEDDPAEITFATTPMVEVIKTLDEIGSLPGDEAVFTITVRNTGDVTVTDLGVTDSLTDLDEENARELTVSFVGSDGAPASPVGTLVPGEVATYTATATLTQADIDSSGLSNVAVARGTTAQGFDLTDISDDDGDGFDDPTIAPIAALPSFAISKVVGEAEFVFPTIERRVFTIEVTNTGNITQTGINLRDDLAAFLSPAVLLGEDFPVTLSIEGFENGEANPTYNGLSDTALLGGDPTLAPGETGRIDVTVTYAGQPGAPNTATVTSGELATPTEALVTVATVDTDGDGIPDRLESPTADRDGDGVPDRFDYDPTGVFYCEDDGRLLTGGTITVSGNGATQTGTGTTGPITVLRDGRLGDYQFFVTRAGDYTLTLTYPDGTVASTTRVTRGSIDVTGLLPDNPGVIGAGPAADTGVLTDFSAAANPFYTGFNFAPGDPVVINNNIPVTQCAELRDVVATKTADRKTAVFGETVNYTLSFANQTDLPYPAARLVDRLPVGMIYTPGSARLDGVAVEPEVNGRRLEWRADLGENETRVLSLSVRVARTGAFGERTNRAHVEDRFGRILSNIAEASVRIDPEHVFDCSDVIGRVFDDRNGNGYQDGPGTLPAPIIEDSYIGDGKFGKLDSAPRREDQTEPGLPGVRLVTPDGLLITTDEHGRYSVPCAALPRNIGSNFMLKLETRTLPTGYRVTTENPRVVRLTAGKFAKLNFGARLGRVVDVDLTAAAFAAGEAEPKPGLSGAIEGLITQIADTPSVLNLTYVLEPGEPSALARERLRAMERLIRQRWRGRGSYKLDIEKTVTRTR
ncbi:hypothetical protein ACNQ62_00960 [Sulfitobacter sp. SBS6]|uniref:DUF7507 domain-containing protein n=1 Tax=Sulfitobacter sp. SBS6 TaxID=3401755 RepID=UPI003AADB62C